MATEWKVIRIDQSVWRELQQNAEPFSDSPNKVLRRLFGLDREEGSMDLTFNEWLEKRELGRL